MKSSGRSVRWRTTATIGPGRGREKPPRRARPTPTTLAFAGSTLATRIDTPRIPPLASSFSNEPKIVLADRGFVDLRGGHPLGLLLVETGRRRAAGLLSERDLQRGT